MQSPNELNQNPGVRHLHSLKRILLVDDNAHDTELALNALADYHLANEVISLRDGAEALDYRYRRNQFAARANSQPDVILLDLKMLKADGLEVLRQLKNDPNLNSIPVVVMTSSREEQDLVNSYQLGLNAYVVQPAKYQQFVDAVKHVGEYWAVLNERPPESVTPRTFAGIRDLATK